MRLINNHPLFQRYGFLRQGSVARDAAILGIGAAISQAINVAFYPLITRIYPPEALGVLAVFTAVASALTPLATLSLHLAINLPKSDDTA